MVGENSSHEFLGLLPKSHQLTRWHLYSCQCTSLILLPDSDPGLKRNGIPDPKKAVENFEKACQVATLSNFSFFIARWRGKTNKTVFVSGQVLMSTTRGSPSVAPIRQRHEVNVIKLLESIYSLFFFVRRTIFVQCKNSIVK